MATRRIARGRGGSPVPIIILSVLLVGAIAVAVVFGMKADELENQRIPAMAEERDQALLRQRAAVEKLTQYKTLVGLADEQMQRKFDTLKDELLEDAMLEGAEDGGPLRLKTVTDLVEAYAREVGELRNTVNSLETELAQAREARKQTDEQMAALKTEHQEEIQRLKAQAAQAADQRDKLQAQLDQTSQKLQAQIASLESDKTKLSKDLNHWQKRYEIASEKTEDLKKQIDTLKHPVDVRGSLVDTGIRGEPVDGKIMTIEPDGQHVMIDLGRQDWVQMGMEFSVYDNADPESREVKGHIQVRKVFDTIAQAKVLEQDELDPILPGMVIVNPAFERGKTLDFVLVTPFREPNVEQLLARYPCRVKKVSPADTDKLDRDTDYVILGEGQLKEGVTRPAESPTTEQAKDWGITVMAESDLLRYLGEL
ncbi:MAG: hypothetical protein ACODAJ_04160 [Planctomycetota bacterium]